MGTHTLRRGCQALQDEEMLGYMYSGTITPEATTEVHAVARVVKSARDL